MHPHTPRCMNDYHCFLNHDATITTLSEFASTLVSIFALCHDFKSKRPFTYFHNDSIIIATAMASI